MHIARFVRASAFFCVYALLIGCGGGGGGRTTPSPLSVATSPGGGTSSATASTQIVLTIPTLAASSGITRSRANVSPATQSFVVTLVSANGTSDNLSVETDVDGPGCVTSSGATACTASIAAPVGSDVFSVALYAQPGGTGTLLGSVTAPETITENATNRIALDVNGVVDSLYLAIVTPAATAGTPANSAAYIVALDPSGNIIVLPGGYVTPITITSSDSTGHVKLTLNGGTAASSVQSTSPHDLLDVVYDGGGGIQTASITASTTGTSGTVSAVAPFAVGTVSPVAFTLTPGTYTGGGHAIAFTSSAAAETATFTVSGGAPPYAVHSADTSTATVSPASGTATTTFTVTSVAVGATSIVITDDGGATTTIPVSIAAHPLTTSVTPGTDGAFSGSTLTLIPGATATIALSGGSGIYSASSNAPGVAAVSAGTSSPYTLTAASTGTATVTLGDTLGDTVGSGPQAITVDVVTPLAVNPASVTFAAYGSSGTQTVTATGGLAPYLVNGAATQSTGLLTWTTSGGSIALTATGPVQQVLNVTDALGESASITATATTLTVPIQ